MKWLKYFLLSILSKFFEIHRFLTYLAAISSMQKSIICTDSHAPNIRNRSLTHLLNWCPIDFPEFQTSYFYGKRKNTNRNKTNKIPLVGVPSNVFVNCHDTLEQRGHQFLYQNWSFLTEFLCLSKLWSTIIFTMKLIELNPSNNISKNQQSVIFIF